MAWANAFSIVTRWSHSVGGVRFDPESWHSRTRASERRTASFGFGAFCTGVGALVNGIQIFPGSVPIYRGNVLAGAIGVSGDGIDQDDMVAFLGLANASTLLNATIANAPPVLRADTVVPQGQGTRLRYVNCPQAPFNGSTQQNVCAGL